MNLYLEDVPVGYQSTIGEWQLTRDEIIELAKQWDPQPFHIDDAAAERSVFGGLVASSLHVFALCTRLFFDHEDQIQILAMLSKDKIRLQNPARVGDTLTYSTECISNNPSSSKPDRGSIILSDTVTNQRDETVLSQEVTLLVASRAGSG